jgi:hypothetical protein
VSLVINLLKAVGHENRNLLPIQILFHDFDPFLETAQQSAAITPSYRAAVCNHLHSDAHIEAIKSPIEQVGF